MPDEGASYVDPVINQTVFTQIDLLQNLPELLQFKFPERFLPTFLHEATHHWCFTSPVGTTLALLRMRACRRATMAAAGYGSEYIHWDLLEDVLRQEIAQALLRPHAEGLACFMELDALPGSSNVISLPSLLALQNFNASNNDEEGRRNPILYLCNLLRRARFDPQLTERRTDLLASHFEVMQGGHLAGYMIVKGLWRRARMQSMHAFDAELFACFLRAYFWDDYGLVNVLLDPSLSEHNAVNAIAGYFVKRFNQLLDMDLDRELSIFEASYLKSSSVERLAGKIPVGHFKFDGIGISDEDWESGTRRLDDLFAELSPKMIEMKTDQISGEWLQSMLEEFDHVRLNRRELLCIGSLDVDVEINSFGRVTAYHGQGEQRSPVFAGLALDPTPQEASSGSIEFYLLPRWRSWAFCVLRNDECVSAQIDKSLSDQDQAHLKSLFETRSSASRMVMDAEANLTKVIDQDSIHFVYDQFKDTAHAGLEKFALDMIISLVDGPVAGDFRTKLAAGGMFKLCNDDPILLRGLAFLGVAWSVSFDRQEVEASATRQGVDLTRTIAELKVIESLTGYPLLIDAPNHFMVLL